MREDTKIALTTPQTSVPAVSNTYQLDQKGDGTNIGIAQNVDLSTIQIYMPIQNGMGNAVNPVYRQPLTINTNYYSLFVIAHEKYKQPYVLLDLSRALTTTYGTNETIHNRLASFSAEAITEIKTYPAVFAGENYRYCQPDEPAPGPQHAFYGFVTDVKIQDNGKVRVYYQLMPMCSIPQDLLNSMIQELDIRGNYKINELDKTHWSIKNINLIEEMKLKGISLFVPTL